MWGKTDNYGISMNKKFCHQRVFLVFGDDFYYEFVTKDEKEKQLGHFVVGHGKIEVQNFWFFRSPKIPHFGAR